MKRRYFLKTMGTGGLAVGYARVETALCGEPTGSTFRYTRGQERARASIARDDTAEGLPA